MFLNEDTIAALATPAGFGAIAVIRISGSNALEAVDKIFTGRLKLVDSLSHTIHYGKILNDGDILDDVLVSVFRKPNSYTGEDSVEISTHGNSLIVNDIIALLLQKGIRLAEPGEFTKRAFLNNRIDLAQAEAVVDVINSRTRSSLKGARNQLDGILSGKINFLRDSLINLLSFVELELDFSEEDLELVKWDQLQEKIETIIKEIEVLLQSYSFGKIIKDGVNVALVGKPNVGKSSLLNYILKESRAIVSHIPGTTRDIIREDVSIDGIYFRLSDTAGIRISEDEIEKEGILRSREAVRNSDIILLIEDVEELNASDLYNELKRLAPETVIIHVMNKIDLGNKYNKEADVFISSLTGEGINHLFTRMKEAAFRNSGYTEKSAIISNFRHYQCLLKAKENLSATLSSINKNLSGEFIAIDLRLTTDNLGEIIGIVTSEEILANIFQNFCIGK